MVRSEAKRRGIRQSTSDRLFQTMIAVLMGAVLFVTLYPLIFIISASFSDPTYVNSGQVWFFPKGITLEGYQRVFRNADIWTGYRNTLLYTFFGTLINLAITIPAAYALSDPTLKGRGFLSKFMIFTMFFSGGLIPTYMLVQNLHMTNTVWALLIPNAVNTTNLIVTRTFFASSIPRELKDAAEIDGCSTYRLFFSIVLPLSSAIIAVMALFYGIGHWNSYFNAMIYLNNRKLFPLQLFLQEILLTQQINMDRTIAVSEMESIAVQQRLAEMVKYVVIVVSTLPVLVIYPFMQKYFVRGVMIGSIKG